ncbi:hypothetical protein JB92DRAFT_3099509 [Gautieria morchelliformis]|nr:hypothetical protein JB92DRAFT_3099509 [Gautieria morchelliformis]
MLRAMITNLVQYLDHSRGVRLSHGARKKNWDADEGLRSRQIVHYFQHGLEVIRKTSAPHRMIHVWTLQTSAHGTIETRCHIVYNMTAQPDTSTLRCSWGLDPDSRLPGQEPDLDSDVICGRAPEYGLLGLFRTPLMTLNKHQILHNRIYARHGICVAGGGRTCPWDGPERMGWEVFVVRYPVRAHAVLLLVAGL